MKGFKLAVAAFVAVSFVVVGCKSAKQEAPAPAPASQAQPGAPVAQAPASVADDSSLSGKVVETMNAAGYTYICLEKKGKKSWFAVPAATVKVGQELTLQPGSVMTNFTSKTLNRTFDTIIFSPGIR